MSRSYLRLKAGACHAALEQELKNGGEMGVGVEDLSAGVSAGISR